MSSSALSMTSPYIHSFRTLFFNSRSSLQALISSNNQEDNKILLQLHFLMNELQQFFDEPAEQDPNNNKYHLNTPEMEVIHERASEKEISSKTLKEVQESLRGNKNSSKNVVDMVIPKVASKHSASFSSPKHCSKGSNDSLNQPECMYTPPENIVELEDAIEKYENAVKTIANLNVERGRLEQKVMELNDKMRYFEREREGLVGEKKECLGLLVKHAEEREVLEGENERLRGVVRECEEKLEMIEEELREKGELLDEIQHYLRQDKQPDNLRPDQHRITFKPSLKSKSLQHQNQSLSIQLTKLSESLQILTSQNLSLKHQYNELQESMDSLLRDNQQFYHQVQQLKKQIKNQHNKNKQLIKIQEGKRLNDMVHKQNKHLLQINYELGNKVYELETEVGKLRGYIQKVEGKGKDMSREMNSLEKTYQKSKLNITAEETMNYTPKGKLSFKGTGDRFLQYGVGVSGGQTEDYEKSRFMEQGLKGEVEKEKEKNRELEGKVHELVCEIMGYEKELGDKKREVERLNVSLNKALELNKNKLSNPKPETYEIDESRNIATSNLSVQFVPSEPDQVNQQQFMSLQSFTQRFEPSPMDILFIMLRISQLCQTMLSSDIGYSLSPTNVFLILDDPDHPENIFVKIEKEKSPRESVLFISPEAAMRRGREVQESAVVWNMGMLFYFLLYKSPYFTTIQELIEANEDEIVLGKMRFPEVEEIVEKMIRREPEERVEIKDALEMIAAEINKMLEEEQC